MNKTDAKGTAESAEVRKVGTDKPQSKRRRGLEPDKVGGTNCGTSAEELRKPIAAQLPDSPGALFRPSLVLQPEQSRAKLCPQPTPSASRAPLMVINSWGWSWLTEGFKDQLIDAGLCLRSDFPAGRRRVSRWTGEDGRRRKLMSLGCGRYCLEIHKTAADMEAARLAEQRERDVERRLCDLPKSAAAYRCTAAGYVAALASMLQDFVREKGGYSVSPDGWAMLRRHLGLLGALVESLPVEFNAAALAKEVAEIEAGRPAQPGPPVVRSRPRLVSSRPG